MEVIHYLTPTGCERLSGLARQRVRYTNAGKLRAAIAGRGKRGGARVIYCVWNERDQC